MDTRLIQTAVLGDPESDEPVICPEDPEELDAFRLEHAENTWWCGINLAGGCGRQLITRRYTDKVCHFAHVPDPDGISDPERSCERRRRASKHDADHLFIKADIARWLRQQNIDAELVLPGETGSAVTARLPDGRLLVIHLDTSCAPAWDDEDVWQYILGPGCRISSEVLAQRGHVLRIRMDGRSDRGRRFVVAGLERAGMSTDWFDLSNLKVTADSIITVDEAQLLATKTARDSKQSTSDQQPTAGIVPSGTAVPRSRDHRPPVARRLDNALYDNSASRIGSALRTAEHAIAHDTALGDEEMAALKATYKRGQQWMEKRARLRKSVLDQLQERVTAHQDPVGLNRQARELIGEEGATDEERAQFYAVQRQLQQTAADQREAENQKRAEAARAVQEAKLLAAEERRRAAQEQQLALERQEAQKEEQARIDRLTALVPAVRGGLKRAAGKGETRTWQELQYKTGARGLTGLSYDDRVELLVMVEQKTPPDEPLWSVLLTVAEDQQALALHRAVCAGLGRDTVEDDLDLIAQLTAQRAELHRLHR